MEAEVAEMLLQARDHQELEEVWEDSQCVRGCDWLTPDIRLPASTATNSKWLLLSATPFVTP